MRAPALPESLSIYLQCRDLRRQIFGEPSAITQLLTSTHAEL